VTREEELLRESQTALAQLQLLTQMLEGYVADLKGGGDDERQG